MKQLSQSRHRSILFVPATRPDRYAKAVDSGADVVCVDLEDAVSLADKDRARELVTAFFAEPRKRGEKRVLRINQLASEHGLKDMLLLLNMNKMPDMVLLPKVESVEDINGFNQIFSVSKNKLALMALIETAKGLENAMSIAAADNVNCIVFGSADYSAEIGSDMGWDALQYGRGRIVQAAGQAGIDAIDGAWLDLQDDVGLIKESQRVAAMGFVGKPALHPKQVAGLHRAFTPSEEDVQQAQRIVDAYQKNAGGVLSVDGRMIDAPVVARALRLVGSTING